MPTGEKMSTKNTKSSKKLLEAQMLFRVTNDEKIKFENKAKRMQTNPSKILRDFVQHSDNLQYLFSHDDALQFSVSLGRLNGQVKRMSYELNRINNHDGVISNDTLEEVKDLLNDVGEKYDEILTAIYGNIQPTKVDRKSKELADAIANDAEPDELVITH